MDELTPTEAVRLLTLFVGSFVAWWAVFKVWEEE